MARYSGKINTILSQDNTKITVVCLTQLEQYNNNLYTVVKYIFN